MKYAIFDLDGTLLDSMHYWRGFGKYFLQAQGIEPDEEIQRITKGAWAEELSRIFKEKYNLSTTPSEIHDWALSFIVQRYTHDIHFRDTAKELLDTLYNDGVKMCLCSSTDKEMMLPALERLDMLKYFDFTVHCRAFGKEKDEEDIFLYCMEKLGAENPKDVWVFEDALYSAKTARQAGFYVVGIYDETEPNQDGLKQVANQYVTDYSQLELN